VVIRGLRRRGLPLIGDGHKALGADIICISQCYNHGRSKGIYTCLFKK
jgi:hypothetical protein